MIRVVLGSGSTYFGRKPSIRILKKGGEERTMAYSEDFAKIVKDIMGTDGAHNGQKRTGISSTYLGQMRRGKIPRGDILGRFALGYNVNEKWTRRLFEIAEAKDPEAEPERLITIACIGAGITTDDRLEVLSLFRLAMNRRPNAQEQESSTA
jgi:hypothetical protein